MKLDFSDEKVPCGDDIKNGSASFFGIPIVYRPNAHFEGRNNTSIIEIGPKFFNYSDSVKRHILIHEVCHNISDKIIEDDWDIVTKDGLFIIKKLFSNGRDELSKEYLDIEDKLDSYYCGGLRLSKPEAKELIDRKEEIVKEIGRKPKYYYEGLFGDVGALSLAETITDCLTMYFDGERKTLMLKYPKAYDYIDSYLRNNNYEI